MKARACGGGNTGYGAEKERGQECRELNSREALLVVMTVAAVMETSCNTDQSRGCRDYGFNISLCPTSIDAGGANSGLSYPGNSNFVPSSCHCVGYCTLQT